MLKTVIGGALVMLALSVSQVGDSADECLSAVQGGDKCTGHSDTKTCSNNNGSQCTTTYREYTAGGGTLSATSGTTSQTACQAVSACATATYMPAKAGCAP
jgi:hypothetical protein